MERNWKRVDALLQASRLLQETDTAHRRYLLNAGDHSVSDYR